ncbi:MAG: dihydropteroate synthase, partial [Candidatus Omnitrophica bacterium]|nr:dihydropteroate synthase [Candidatus Omnitrophota bacterium]
MGILNVTPDSFSDGGKFFSPRRALDRALKMEEEGADLIDVGGESTRKDAAPVSTEDELKRVLPVVEGLRRTGLPISIDTMKAEVAEAAL